jgi:aldose 1-epimerase
MVKTRDIQSRREDGERRDRQMKSSESVFGTLPDGRKVKRFTVENSRGISISAITYGATLTAVNVPDATGRTENVILFLDSLEEYRTKSPFFGALVGRFANRITRGRFVLDGREYTLACNDVHGAGPNAVSNHLHGGTVGYDKVLWNAKPFVRKGAAGIRWTYTSRDGEEGYPGTLKITAEYTLTESNELSFEYWAVTDKPTPVNLTNHAYWNLAGAGAGSGTVLEQELMFNCPFYIPIDSSLMPTGEVLSVKGTPFDFTAPKPIGRDIAKVDGGYDHCLVVKRAGSGFDLLCKARDPRSGRAMEVRTTKPSVQFYSGNFLNGSLGSGGRTYPLHGAFTLETEFFPDCVNFSHFPSCILRPGQRYHHLSTHTFGG